MKRAFSMCKSILFEHKITPYFTNLTIFSKEKCLIRRNQTLIITKKYNVVKVYINGTKERLAYETNSSFWASSKSKPVFILFPSKMREQYLSAEKYKFKKISGLYHGGIITLYDWSGRGVSPDFI